MRGAVFGVVGFFLPAIDILLGLRARALRRRLAVHLRKLLDQLALFFRDLLGNVHTNGREQIAASAPVPHADARAVADPGGDLHLPHLGLVLDPGASAYRARVLDLASAPAARWTRAREREHPLAFRRGAGAAARGARMRPAGAI